MTSARRHDSIVSWVLILLCHLLLAACGGQSASSNGASDTSNNDGTGGGAPGAGNGTADAVCSRADVLLCDDFEWGVNDPSYTVWRDRGWKVDSNFFDQTQYPAGNNVYTGVGLNGSAGIQWFLAAATATSGTPYPYRNFADLTGPGYNKVHVRWYAKWSENWVWDNIGVKHFYVRGLVPGENMDWRVPIFIQQDGGMNVEIYGPVYSCNPRDLFLQQNQGRNIYFSGAELGKWHAIEMMVKLNTGAAQDGEVAVWVDGIKRLHHTGIQIRCPQSTVGINDIWITSYWGGSGTETHPDMHVWYDNVVVSTEYIGSVGNTLASP